MPIHEYHCAACDARFDHLARRLGDKPKTCAKCGKPGHLTRQLSTFTARTAASSSDAHAACETCPGAAACGGGCGGFDD